MATIEAAFKYTARGWHVLPTHSAQNGKCTCGNPECKRIGKHPLTTHGVNDATRDKRIIEESGAKLWAVATTTATIISAIIALLLY